MRLALSAERQYCARLKPPVTARDTVLRSYDGRNIIIPNSKLITEVVVNNTTAKLRRESITIAIPAGSAAGD